MQYETQPKQQQEQEVIPESRKQVFDLEQMEPSQIVDLVGILGAALMAEEENPSLEYRGATTLHDILEKDIENLPRRNLEMAVDLYFALATAEQAWPRAVAATNIPRLYQNVPESQTIARQQVVNLWITLLHDTDACVTEFAVDTTSTAIDTDWIDETTARRLDSHLPSDRRRADWRVE